MFATDHLVDKKIEQAIAQGYFENLAGNGSPIDLEDNVYVPDSLKMAFRVLKNSGTSPYQVQVLKEIHSLKQKLKCAEDPYHSKLLLHQIQLLQLKRDFQK